MLFLKCHWNGSGHLEAFFEWNLELHTHFRDI